MALRLIVTRPAAQAADWVRQLAALGLQAQALPLIGIEPVADPALVRAAWRALPNYTLLMFVSANAVEHFFAAADKGAAWPDALLAGATGPGTSSALRQAGLRTAQIVQPDAQAGQFDSEALWARLQALPWIGRRVLVVRGEDGRDWLAQVLEERGAVVDFVAAYRRTPPQLDADAQALLAAACTQPQRHVWLFSSSEAVGWLRALAPTADWSRGRALASHPRIVQAARDLGFGQVQLTAPTTQAVAQAAIGLDAIGPGATGLGTQGPSIE